MYGPGRVAARERKELEMETFMEHLAATSAAIPAEMSVPEIVEAMRLVGEIMCRLAEHAETDVVREEVGEAFAKLPPHVLAPIVMQHLPHVDAAMSVKAKQYWLAMADELGTDWFESFRTAANWMRMAGGFK